MTNKIKVLSLFDGIAGARQALKELNINCEYFASEIDKYAISIAQKNHPDTIQVGDVRSVAGSVVGVDLLIGGSPCQDLSIAKKDRQGLEGQRSGLFFDYLRILKEAKPRFFILENVASMNKQAKDEITNHLFGIEPIMINSALVTAQQRKRYYWVGKLQEDGNYKKVEIKQPEDQEIYLKDILESGDTEKLKSYCVTATYSGACPRNYFYNSSRQLIFKKPVKVGHFNKGGQGDRVYHSGGKSVCLSALGGGRGAKTGLYEIKDMVRKLTPIECERLQGFSDNYTDGISNSQRYKALGNSFTVPAIKHILNNLEL